MGAEVPEGHRSQAEGPAVGLDLAKGRHPQGCRNSDCKGWHWVSDSIFKELSCFSSKTCSNKPIQEYNNFLAA